MTGADLDAVADALAGFVEVRGVPDGFAEYVTSHVAARPSPNPVDPTQTIIAKLDHIIELLEGGRQ